MLKSLVSGIKLYLDKRLKEQRDETDGRIADQKWHETTATQLFSETVTTVLDDGVNYGEFTSYGSAITADPLLVTFNGTEYVCPARPYDGGSGFDYGASIDDTTGTYIWNDFPFFISSTAGFNYILTETPGTYTVSASAKETTYNDAFKEGVRACALKEVETLEEADIAVITVTTRIASNSQATNFTIYKDSNDVQFLASSVNKYLEPEVYYFWKDKSNMLSNFGYMLLASNDGLWIKDNAEIDTNSSASSLYVYGIGNYALTSSNASWKFYNIGLTASSGGDGGDGGGDDGGGK